MNHRHYLVIMAILGSFAVGMAGTINTKPVKSQTPPAGAIAASLSAIQSSTIFAQSGQSTPVNSTASVPSSLFPRTPLASHSTGIASPAPSVIWNVNTGVARSIVPVAGTSATVSGASPTQTARAFLTANASLLRVVDPSNEFTVTSSDRDNLNMTHVRLQQSLAGIPVWASDVYVHLGADGQVSSFNGSSRPTPQLSSLAPAFDAPSAISIARSHMSTTGTPEGVPANLSGPLRYSSPTAQLVIWHDDWNKPHLVWLVDARSGLRYDWQYFVDAQTGDVLDRYNNVCFDGAQTANATDLNGASRTVNTYLSNGTYYLLDAAEPMYNAGQSSIPQTPVGGIMGYDLRNNDLTAQATIYFTTSTNNTWTDPSAISAHYNAKVTYNYYRTAFGRNSIDDKGMSIYSIVHVTEGGQGMDNAFWSGTLMCYGDGNVVFKPLAGGFDVAAHEMTHGVTQYTAGLIYKNQSGALNESMSDAFAAALDSSNWTIGEQVVKDLVDFPNGTLRDLSNPHNGGANANSAAWQPANMSEFINTTSDNGGVHGNSGIPNFAFYKTATAASMSHAKAAFIWYRALTKYMTSSAQFVDARIATENAAKDIYGNSSPELTAVQNAWTAVGVNGGTATPPPTVPQLQGAGWVSVVNTDNTDPNSLYLVRPVLQGNVGDFTALSNTFVSSRPAVSDTGGVIVFVDGNHRLRALRASTSPGEGYVDTQAVWSSVAIGPGLSSLALTSIYADTSIYYVDFTKKKTTAIKVRTQTYDGAPAGTAVYCDEMSFDPTGRYLLFDTFNQTKTVGGGTLTFWNINLMDLSNGQMQSVFPPQPEGIDVGNPSFSKSNPSRFVFDMVDNKANTDYVMGADFFAGEYGAIVGPLAAIGFPTYSGDGSMIAYHNAVTSSGVTHHVIEQVGVNTAGTGPNGSAQQYVIDATYPNWFVIGKRVTAVGESAPTVPMTARLEQNYPNPFNPTTRIAYVLPARAGSALRVAGSDVRLAIYDVLGREVAVLVDEVQAPGRHEVTFDAGRLASGVYFYKLQAGDFVSTKRMILMK
jgi:Zn-dependent metalloprotease